MNSSPEPIDYLGGKAANEFTYSTWIVKEKERLINETLQWKKEGKEKGD